VSASRTCGRPLIGLTLFDLHLEPMTPKERQNRFADIAARLWTIRGELEHLLPDLQLAVDQKAVRQMLTRLAWDEENCTVVGKHQVGEAMDDAMGMSADGKVA
jgi:hypothetical protein